MDTDKHGSERDLSKANQGNHQVRFLVPDKRAVLSWFNPCLSAVELNSCSLTEDKKEPAPGSSSGTGSCVYQSHRNVTSESVQRFRPWRLEDFGVTGADAAAAACGWVAALTSGLLSHLGAQQLVFMVIVVGLVDSLIMN